MKNGLLIFGSFLLLFGGGNCLAQKDQYEKVSLSSQAKPLSEILNPDGAVRMGKGSAGTFDPRGFQLIGESEKPPNFVQGNSFYPAITKSTGVAVSVDGKWDDRFTTGLGINGVVYAIIRLGDNLYAGGGFSLAGTIAANNIVKWDGTSWSALGLGVDGPIRALAAIGTDLYAGGFFSAAGGIAANNIAKWDGTSWTPLGSGTDWSVHCLAVIGNDLYAGGRFFMAGGITANGIAKWNGSNWSALGSGIIGISEEVESLVVMGTDIYAGGLFSSAGGISVRNIAKWDGTSWTALGSGINNPVQALAAVGTDLYAGGTFWEAGGVGASRIAKWDGNTWLSLGSGPNGTIYSLDVNKSDIYVGGSFSKVGDIMVTNIAKWNGVKWSALGSGLNDRVYALATNNADVYVGGNFSGISGGIQSVHFAIWHSNQLVVTNPNGGQIWKVGSIHNIAWTTNGDVGFVKLEYSANGGSSWTTIISSAENTGSYAWTVPNTPSANCFVRVSDAANATISDVSDSAFAITITEPPAINLSRTALNFGAIQSSAATAGQTVIIGNSGGGTLVWSASSNQTWLLVTPATGTGTGVLQISVGTAGLAVGSYSGAITVSASSAVNSPQTITVGLTIKAQGTSAAPFGSFDTPSEGTTGITGAIPVTGWVVDDVEVVKVEILRDNVAGETPGQWAIGDAIFVEGARPDVETAYSEYPLNYRAGWGYMLLTNFLPNQGNGTYKLYAYATDKEGNQVTLGTKSITCSNATAVKPFGTIDTPAQGGDASGNPFLNFGWVLTPLPKTVPVDGSTIDIYVDSVKVGNLATAPNVYDQYRVDVATAFPGLNNSGGPVGAFYLDTTKYPNGVHTIYWIAMDDQGAADGIGSRYFNIINTGTTSQVSSQVIKLEEADSYESVMNLPVSFEQRNMKKGFTLKAESEIIQPDNSGTIQIKMREVERVELDLGKAKTIKGYLIVANELRPLPIGSTLDTKKGTFSWMPGPGFIGTYHLLFLQTDGFGVTRRIPVNILIRPEY